MRAEGGVDLRSHNISLRLCVSAISRAAVIIAGSRLVCLLNGHATVLFSSLPLLLLLSSISISLAI